MESALADDIKDRKTKQIEEISMEMTNIIEQDEDNGKSAASNLGQIKRTFNTFTIM